LRDLPEKLFAYQHIPALEEYVVASRDLHDPMGADLPPRQWLGAPRDAPRRRLHAAQRRLTLELASLCTQTNRATEIPSPCCSQTEREANKK
jgi:hypothetical protein